MIKNEHKNIIKKLCIISPGYPTDFFPVFSFVDQLLCAFSENGIECTVISPQSLIRAIIHKEYRRPIHWIRYYKNVMINIYQPFYMSFSNMKVFDNSLSDIFFEKSVFSLFKELYKKEKFDAVYGHFWNCGLIAAKIGKKYGLPAFVACGESEINIDEFSRNLKYIDYLNGVICVSSKCLNDCIKMNLCSKEKAIVLPNAIDNELFYLKNKSDVRKALGFSQDVFIVAFVGSFIVRKGSKRLSEALESIPNAQSIFIGSGPEVPTCPNRLFTGGLSHAKVSDYLNASDIFVLPTYNEGCCNAIVEAMACGLPIISSDLPFNWDILNKENSILINPTDINEIRNAIIFLMKNLNKRKELSINALNTAKRLTINNRANSIIEYMERRNE